MTHRYFQPFIVAFLLLAAPLSPLVADQRIDDDEWYTLTLQDQRCGYMHTTTHRIGDEVRSNSLMRMTIARGTVKVGISVEQEYRESLDGKPLFLLSRTAMGEVPVVYSGEIKNGKIALTIEQFGAKRTNTYPFDPEIRLAYGQLLAQRERGMKAGTSYSVKTYDPNLKPDGPVTMQINVKGKEEVDVLGKAQKLNHVIAVMNLPSPPVIPGSPTPDKSDAKDAPSPAMNIESEMWTDDEARPIIMTVDIGIARVRMLQSTKEEALKDADPPELFLNTFVPVSRHIGQAPREVIYRLRVPAKGDLGVPELPNTSMQTFKRINKYEAELTVRRLDWNKIRAVKSQGEVPEKIREYLRASSVVDINDAKIKRLAKRSVKDKLTPADKADAMRNFVTDYIENKGMDVGFATASEVARNKQGDCTEHAVLLAALARASGIPSRGVSGLVEVPEGYESGNAKSSFGYHMWTQVYIADQWVDIDGAMRQTDCDATHIALSLMPLNEGGMVESLTSLLPLLGRLEMEIVSAR